MGDGPQTPPDPWAGTVGCELHIVHACQEVQDPLILVPLRPHGDEMVIRFPFLGVDAERIDRRIVPVKFHADLRAVSAPVVSQVDFLEPVAQVYVGGPVDQVIKIIGCVEHGINGNGPPCERWEETRVRGLRRLEGGCET